MLSHNMALWEPMHANKRLVTGVLRNRFGLLGGYIGSDMGNVMQLQRNYGFASTGGVATTLAMEAGLDQNMGGEFATQTKPLVLAGTLHNATLDRAVGNILRKKFASGLFDMPPTDPAGLANIGSPAHRALARDAARQGLVLLINRPAAGHPSGHPTGQPGALLYSPPPPSTPPLPATPAAGAGVAVIGELGGCGPGDNSTDCVARMGLLGGYTPVGTRVVTIEDAFNARGFRTTWTPGVPATDGQSRAAAAPGIAAAVAAVAAAELTVLAVGCVQCSCCNRCGCGEAGDRQSFELEGQQLALMDAVLAAGAKLGKLVVVVTVCGRPVTFSSTDLPANSILVCRTWAGL